MIKLVRVSTFNGDEYGGCIDVPDNCSRRMVIASYAARGYCQIVIPFVDGRIRMMNEHGYLVVIEDGVDENKKTETRMYETQISI